MTITAAFARTVAARSDIVALRAGTGDDAVTLTWAQYADAAARVAAGLAQLGLRPGERVALMIRNRPEFHVADMGILLAGGTPVSISNSSPPDRIAYVLHHAGARLAVVDDVFAERFAAARQLVSGLDKVVRVGPQDGGADRLAGDSNSAADFRSSGGSGDIAFSDLTATVPVELERAAAAIRPEDLLTVIYTSGTTGDPKGVLLTHANLTFAVDTYRTVLGRSLEGLRQVSFLPMAHIAERLATHYFHVCEGSDVTTCDDLAALVPTMARVQPEWFFSAPRLWEKLQAAIEAMAAADPAERKAFAAARALGWRVFLAERDRGGTNPSVLAERDRGGANPLLLAERDGGGANPSLPAESDGSGADSSLLAEWREVRARQVAPLLERVGLGHVLIALTGAAPIPKGTSEFFLSLGVPLSEVWGMSETAGLGTWSPHHIVPGTTGRPVPGVEIRLGADDEILVRGPCVFGGYLDDPARTAEVLDAAGWLHTGDAGRFDADGNLSIVDRLKDIIVPSSGHNVSPAGLEARLKECPLIGQACVVGDGRPHVAALVVPDPETARLWADTHGLAGAALPDVCAHPAFRAEVAAFVASINDAAPPAERIMAFEIVPDEWLPDSDVLTPTAKLKRRAVNQRYAALIDRLYKP